MVTTVRNIVEKARRAYIWQSETVSINKKAHLYEQVHWSKHRQDVFDDYWISNYGKKIPNKWHRLYESINGVFNVEYFPERLFTSLYEPTVNRIDYCRTLRDKSFLQTMFGHVDEIRIPKTLLLSSGRYFYDGSQNIITKEEALSLVNNIGEAVIKPTIVHGSGVNIVIVDIKNGIDSISGEAIGSILSRYGSNFCIQEKIIPHQSYKALYEGSINTIKIMTYIIEGSIYHDPISLRIGSGGSWLDNIHAGGLCVGVREDGTLRKYAYRLGYGNCNEKLILHPDSGFVFEGKSVYGINEIIQAAYKLHGMIPNIGAIAWDFCVDKDNNVVLIEANYNGNSAWFPQIVNEEPLFGNNTQDILKFLRKANRF